MAGWTRQRGAIAVAVPATSGQQHGGADRAASFESRWAWRPAAVRLADLDRRPRPITSNSCAPRSSSARVAMGEQRRSSQIQRARRDSSSTVSGAPDRKHCRSSRVHGRRQSREARTSRGRIGRHAPLPSVSSRTRRGPGRLVLQQHVLRAEAAPVSPRFAADDSDDRRAEMSRPLPAIDPTPPAAARMTTASPLRTRCVCRSRNWPSVP